MANPDHLRLIRRGVKRWNQWRDRNLSEQPDLSGANFIGWDLAGINLVGADLCEVNFSEANLKGAHFHCASLSLANLSQANLIEAVFTSAKMIGVNLFQAQLFRADLCRADLSDAILSEIQGEQAFLIDANLKRADLRSACLSKAILSESHLQNANLITADLSKADLSFVDLSGANLAEIDLSKVICIESQVNDANLKGANLYCANCQRTSFQGSLLQSANLSGGNFRESNFASADLRNANLQGAKVANANFQLAQLQEVQWDEPHLIPMVFPTMNGSEVQRSLPATLFVTDSGDTTAVLQTTYPTPPLFSMVDRAVADSTVRSPEATFVTLHFFQSVDWIALSAAIQRINQAERVDWLHLYSLETQVDGSLLVRLRADCGLDEGDLQCHIMQQYEQLCFILANAFQRKVPGQIPAPQQNGFNPVPSAMNQLLDLLTYNLFLADRSSSHANHSG
ncbi:MAG: pentapeptide repeat-containing protein [Thermosynechococcaceae cyanobacterium]